MAPVIAAALVSAVVALFVSLANNHFAASIQKDRLKAEAEALRKRYAYDRELADWQRKTALAEEVLSGFYKAEAIFRSARRPFSSPGEGMSRPGRDADQAEGQSLRDSYYAPLERLEKERDFLTSFNANRYRFAANFGSKSDDPFSVFTRIFNRIQNSTFALIRLHGRVEPEIIRRYEEVIGWGDDFETDKITLEIAEAVSTIEQLCRPVLNFQPSPRSPESVS